MGFFQNPRSFCWATGSWTLRPQSAPTRLLVEFQPLPDPAECRLTCRSKFGSSRATARNRKSPRRVNDVPSKRKMRTEQIHQSAKIEKRKSHEVHSNDVWQHGQLGRIC